MADKQNESRFNLTNFNFSFKDILYIILIIISVGGFWLRVGIMEARLNDHLTKPDIYVMRNEYELTRKYLEDQLKEINSQLRRIEDKQDEKP